MVFKYLNVIQVRSVTFIKRFCDASDHAFATVVYSQTVYMDNSVKTVLIASKTRVPPVKKQSIPHLVAVSL